MHLLVSAATAEDAAAALDGGADIIDAKDPSAGALGAVTLDVFTRIVTAVGAARPVTAALGDGASPASVEADARMFAALGATLVKIGLSGTLDSDAAHAVATGAVRGARAGRSGAGVVLVAYADRPHARVSPIALLEVASAAGAAGVLLDTADKRGPRLTELATLAWLTEWTGLAHRRSLSVALAGRLQAEDLPIARRSGADVAGVRGAACEGGRSGRIVAARVRGLCTACRIAGDLVTHS
jgi:(5-formylfuran-3-yl)methyl phosphate synthase